MKFVKPLMVVGLLFLAIAGVAQLNPEQQSIKKVFFDFLQFYQKNEKQFDAFKLYKGTGKDNEPPYKIQWKEVERYASFLRKNVPYVGEAYINSEKKDFRFYDSCYKADPNEEMVVGFDYDRWGGGQESIKYLIKWHTSKDNLYKVNIKGDKAELLIGSPPWEGATKEERQWSKVPFVKEKGKWVMAGNIDSVDEYNPVTI
jgi:hypothetical protein